MVDLLVAGSVKYGVGRAIEKLAKLPQLEIPLTHSFSPGIYLREVDMASDSYVIGHVHKTRHFNMLLTGRVVVTINGVRRDLVAPCYFESDAGDQKVLYVAERCRWVTVHANPDDERDIAKLEERLLELPADFLLAKGSQTIDEFRMANTRKSIEEVSL